MKEQAVSLHLSTPILQWIEQARGEMDRSAYITKLLEQLVEQAQRDTAERERWIAEGRKQYTADVCRQTLAINDEFPIHEE